MGERDQGEARYRAFLSYSHKDAAPAGRLHRRLEAYRLPRRLVGRKTAHGLVPARLHPIFRDREELPAASDLSQTVREALARSDALIVLCSPDATASLWVAEEIRVFRELHPGRPILAAILEGDAPDCFPELLRAFGKDGTWHEPLATDLRRNRDGKRLGLLKLVAGITGVGLDDLVQRDATRRVRRVTAVTAGAMLAMLAMAVLAVIAVTARQGLERQRTETEGLTEFMLSDLHDRLEGVGRLDIMRAVNQRALDHYDRQIALGDTSPAMLRQRARALLGLAEQDILQGDLRAASGRFEEAGGLAAALLERTPDDLAALQTQSQSAHGLGRVNELRQDWPAAQRDYARSSSLVRRLVRIAPNDPAHMMFAGASAVALGSVALNGTRDFDAAQQHYETAVSWYRRAVLARPDDERARYVLANAYGWLADSYFMRRRMDESLRARARQHPIMEWLNRRHPTNVEIGYRLALAQRGFARLLAHRRGRASATAAERARARTLMFSAYDWSRRLTQLDPLNAEWLLFRGFMGCELYFGNWGGGDGISRTDVRDDIRRVDTTLRSRRDPRVADLSNCTNALH